MGSFLEESSGLLVTHLLYKAALVIAVVRWVFLYCWAFRVRSRSSDEAKADAEAEASSQMIKDNLILTTFGDITDRLAEESKSCDTCAVCLNKLIVQDEVRELRNCCHVFHRECIDRWVDHDHQNQTTCPLCRAPLLTSSQFQNSLNSCGSCRAQQPSWAVERILYLFGDDLL